MTLRPTDAGLRLAIGVPGAGKTFGIMRDVYQAARMGVPCIVIDQTHEWKRADACVRTVAAAVAALDAKKARLVIVRADDDTAAAEEACAWAVIGREQAASRGLGVRGVVFPEAHNLFPSEGRLQPYSKKVATAWRHFHVAAWCDTQRPALLSRTVVDLAGEVRVYAVTGDVDHKALAGIGGRELSEAAHEACARMESGKRGWHVTLGLIRKGPYKLAGGET